MKGESTRNIDILNQVNLFLPLSLLFKVDKVELQFLWNIWLLLATKIGSFKSFTCYF